MRQSKARQDLRRQMFLASKLGRFKPFTSATQGAREGQGDHRAPRRYMIIFSCSQACNAIGWPSQYDPKSSGKNGRSEPYTEKPHHGTCFSHHLHHTCWLPCLAPTWLKQRWAHLPATFLINKAPAPNLQGQVSISYIHKQGSAVVSSHSWGV